MRNFNLMGYYIFFVIFIKLFIQSNTLDLKWKRLKMKAFTDKIKCCKSQDTIFNFV